MTINNYYDLCKSKTLNKVSALLLFLCFVFSASVNAQDITITGKVTDNTGDLLPGVNVVVKGTTRGMFTDENGTYQIDVPNRDAVLVFSYVGFVTVEYPVRDSRQINIVLEEEGFLVDEVVVIGYGSAKKATLAGAVSSIGADEIMTTKTDNLIANIQGKIPGVMIRNLTGQPGTFDNNFSVRGFGTPMFVIDGTVRRRSGANEFAQLNPDDIESITVLKDASSAIYGMGASNGVVIVTTKKGTAGKTNVTYRGSYTVNVPTGMPKMLSAYEYRVMENEFQANVGLAPRYDDATLEGYRLGLPGYPDSDWIDMYLYKSTPAQSHQVNVNGGNDRIRHMTSFAFSSSDGMLTSDIIWYRRFNFRHNMSAELSKNIKMNVNISGIFSKRNRETEDFIWTYKSLIVNDRGVGPYTMANPNHLSRVAPEDKNPAALVSADLEGYRLNEARNMSTSLEFVYSAPFLKGLDISVFGSFDYQTSKATSVNRSHDIFDYLSDDYLQTRGSQSISNSMALWHHGYMKAQASYSAIFGDHSIDFTAVAEMNEQRTDNLSGGRNYTDIFTFPTLDQASVSTATNGGNYSFTRGAGYLARLGYNYQGKYILDAMARYDGSYRYAPGYRWGLFPYISGAWRISEENFFKNNIPFINNLKLRVSYGQVGADQGSAYAWIPSYSQSNGRGYLFEDNVLTVGYYPPGLVKDNMTWETRATYNFGIDIDLLKNRLNVLYEYFTRKNTNILASPTGEIPNYFTAGIPQENLNSNMNAGVELALKWRDRIGKDFNYTIGGQVTLARYKQLVSQRTQDANQWSNWRNNPLNRFTGRNLLYEYDGQFTSLAEYETAPLYGGNRGNAVMLPGSYRLVDRNGDGRISGEDQAYISWEYGSGVNPPLNYSFTVDTRYKDFTLNLYFQGAALYAVNYHMNDIWGYGRYPTLHAKFTDRWHVANLGDDPKDPATVWIPGKYPAGRPYNYENTQETAGIDMWRPKARYLRLKTIELGYQVPRVMSRQIGIESIRPYVNITNLFTFCNEVLKLVDPERGEGDWDAGLSYPLQKGFTFGLSLTF